jgi:hypothetical protein
VSRVREMTLTHPARRRADQNGKLAASSLASTMELLRLCSITCSQCADACLAEDAVFSMLRCIRTNLDCADVCQATAAILSRQTELSAALVRSQLEACVVACRVCAEECQKHGVHHEQCRLCAETCLECLEACERLLQGFHHL